MHLARIRIVTVVVVALAAALFGVTRLFAAFNTEAQATEVGSLDGLNVQVTKAGWIDMGHDMASTPGFQMPPAMMPGMPEQGKERLSVTLTVLNTGDASKAARLGSEFALHTGKDAELVTPQSDTFGELPRLAGRNAVNGTLFFDLPSGELDDSSTWLEWSHGGSTARILVPVNGAVPHQHNS
jgi:hypothetical protein